ncbi:unnamed protein product [Clonostachys chloroleuca]|uniref:Secreted protein n=1 Tax=Clonostachys chloroleuca TaxID=1926264 RepID=A0AA35Q385_9HYPO|nr:unnamed protein product [Clonostachys chloroleuca]
MSLNMRHFATLAGLVLLGASGNAHSNNTFEGMEIVDAKWNLELTPGGRVVNLTGTVEQIYPQLLALNPTYEADWAQNSETNVEYDSFIAEDEDKEQTENPAGSLSVRGPPIRGFKLGKSRIDRWHWITWQQAVPKCNVRRWAMCYDIKKGCKHLERVQGIPQLEDGKCSQMSCSNKSAIIWCNVSGKTRTVPSYRQVAQGAWMIYEQCQEREPYELKDRGRRCWVRGKVFPWQKKWFVQVLGVDSC